MQRHVLCCHTVSGQVVCASQIILFNFVVTQLGTIDILPDLLLPYSFTSPTLGSGGAAPGGGRGGGRIVLSGVKEVYVGRYSLLSADGTEAQDEVMGAGSGGSITVVAGTYTNHGLLSVRGGVSRNQFGGSGGGGRISLTVGRICCVTMR